MIVRMGYADRRRNGMNETLDKYFTCPYCGEILEMDKEEFETKDTEYYFDKE